MDSASSPNYTCNVRGRSRGMGRGQRSPKVKAEDPTWHPSPSVSRPSLGASSNCSPSTLSTLGRGQGLLPRTPPAAAPSPAAPPNFARGRGLGRGAAPLEFPSNVGAAERVARKAVPEAAKAVARDGARDGAGEINATNGQAAEANQEAKHQATAPPPPMASNALDCREISTALQLDTDSSGASDHGDDLTMGSAIRHAMANADSDSDVEDMLSIGRQLRHVQHTEKEVLPRLPTVNTEPAAPRPSKRAQQTASYCLSKWRQELREANLGCLDAGRALEADLIYRWRTEHMLSVVAWLKGELAATADPCAAALALMNWCGPRKTGSKSVDSARALPRLDGAFDIIESVLNTSEALRRRLLEHRTVEARRFAFFLGQREGMDALRHVVALFQLDDELAVPTMKALIDQLVEGGVYKEACQFIGVLGMQHLYAPQQVLLPCIAEGRIIVVEDYVKGNEAAQRQLLRFLDTNFDQQFFLRQLLDKCHPELLQVRHDLLSFTALKKLTLRLQKMFRQPNSVIPRVSGERCAFDLSLLLHERYVRRIKRSDWLTAIQGAVGDSHENAVSLVEYLIDYRLPGAARRWADFYKVTAAEVASLASLQDMEQEKEDDREEEVAAMSAARAQNDYFLPFPLDPENDIEIIQEEQDLWMAIGLASKAEKIGFDAEWTTLYGQSETSISLLQMALPNCVFILDMQRLPAAVESSEVWHHFRTEVFEKNQTKVFFSALQDMKMIWASVPELKTPTPIGATDAPAAASYRGVVDLEQLVTHCAAYPNFFRVPPSGGLSGLVETCLGRPLCKTERLSNWRARPLSRDQRIYAALDAHCLISLHDWLEKRKQEMNLADLDLQFPADLQERKKKKKKKEASQQ